MTIPTTIKALAAIRRLKIDIRPKGLDRARWERIAVKVYEMAHAYDVDTRTWYETNEMIRYEHARQLADGNAKQPIAPTQTINPANATLRDLSNCYRWACHEVGVVVPDVWKAGVVYYYEHDRENAIFNRNHNRERDSDLCFYLYSMTAIDPELDANLKSDFRAMFRDGIVGSDGELDAWVIHDTSDFVADPRARQAMSMVTDGAIVKACQTYRVDADGIARATDDIERIEPY